MGRVVSHVVSPLYQRGRRWRWLRSVFRIWRRRVLTALYTPLTAALVCGAAALVLLLGSFANLGRQDLFLIGVSSRDLPNLVKLESLSTRLARDQVALERAFRRHDAGGASRAVRDLSRLQASLDDFAPPGQSTVRKAVSDVQTRLRAYLDDAKALSVALNADAPMDSARLDRLNDRFFIGVHALDQLMAAQSEAVRGGLTEHRVATDRAIAVLPAVAIFSLILAASCCVMAALAQRAGLRNVYYGLRAVARGGDPAPAFRDLAARPPFVAIEKALRDLDRRRNLSA